VIATALVPVQVDITTSMVAVVTVLAAMVFGLATLARPGQATVTWGVAFGLGVLGAYLWLAGQQTDDQRLRAAASGVLLAFKPLVWAGLRVHVRRRPYWWAVVLFTVLAPVLLVITAPTPWYLPIFHLVFVASGVFAALIVYELVVRKPAARDILMPLILSSGALTAVALATAIAAVTSGWADATAQLSALRGINGVGTVVVSTCAAMSLILMVRADARSPVESGWALLRARRRLAKAQLQNEQAWSILDVRLDDPSDLREVSTGAEYGALVDRFHDDIQEALPAAADAIRIDDAQSVVIIRGADESVQSHVRDILARVSVIERDAPVHGVRASASIGWAPVSAVGFDLDVLMAAAADAARRARESGGDRWVRAAAPAAPGRELDVEIERSSSDLPAGRTTLEG